MVRSLASFFFSDAYRIRRSFPRLFLTWVALNSLTLTFIGTHGVAQIIGEKAEMERLEDQAEEAIANGDPEGATLNSGKAALMASILAKQETSEEEQLVYEGAEALFRAQENGYRALAIFERAGGQPPAPSSVCHMLDLATTYGKTANEKLLAAAQTTQISESESLQHFTSKTHEWVEIIQELRGDFACP